MKLSLGLSLGRGISIPPTPPPNVTFPQAGWVQSGVNEFTYDRTLENPTYEDSPSFGFAVPLIPGNSYAWEVEIVSWTGPAPEIEARMGTLTNQNIFTTLGRKSGTTVAGIDSDQFFFITTVNGIVAAGIKIDTAVIRNITLQDVT